MNKLSLNSINASAPYKVSFHETTHTYRFITDYNVIIGIDFDKDDLIETAETYILSIINVNNVVSPRDAKERDTIMTIIENFFNLNEAALLYICESGDGKQQMRSRLFEYWFSSYQIKDNFLLLPASIVDMEGIENFAALIVKKDNPKFVDIVSEFSNTITMLKIKPNTQND